MYTCAVTPLPLLHESAILCSFLPYSSSGKLLISDANGFFGSSAEGFCPVYLWVPPLPLIRLRPPFPLKLLYSLSFFLVPLPGVLSCPLSSPPACYYHPFLSSLTPSPPNWLVIDYDPRQTPFSVHSMIPSSPSLFSLAPRRRSTAFLLRQSENLHPPQRFCLPFSFKPDKTGAASLSFLSTGLAYEMSSFPPSGTAFPPFFSPSPILARCRLLLPDALRNNPFSGSTAYCRDPPAL